MEDIDFAGIDPVRVPEAKRRVAVLEEYTNLVDPKRTDTQRYADKLKLSVVQFNRLVKTWRNHREPSLLVIGRRGISKRSYGIEERAIEIARECVADAGEKDTLNAILNVIAGRCAIENLRPPSRGTVWNYLREARAAARISTDQGPPRLALERIWVRLPIIDASPAFMPTVLIAVLLPERMIVAHDISVDKTKPPSVARVIADLARVRDKGAEKRPLLLSADDRRVGAGALAAAGLSKVPTYERSVLRELSNAFAGRLGALELIHYRGMAKTAKRRGITRQEAPLKGNVAKELIELAIRAHNEACDTQVAFDILPAGTGDC